MEGEREQASWSLQRTEGAKAAVVHATPRPLELFPWDLPLVELALTDLAPAFEAGHRCSSLAVVHASLQRSSALLRCILRCASAYVKRFLHPYRASARLRAAMEPTKER